VRLAEEANRAITDDAEQPKGVLRVTADPLFGETFLTPLILEYAERWPTVQVEVTLTQRRVDLVEEGFDVAFRIGKVDDPELSATDLGPARVRYCASRGYVARRGAPKTPKQLATHECVLVHAEGGSVKWPFRGARGLDLLPVTGRLRFNSFAMAKGAVLAGLGIAIFPEFACADDVRRKRLVPLLEDWLVDVGSVWLVHPTRRYLTARVRTFVDLARERLRREAPWARGETRRATR
jgi:DNA-binding transcriptional LysR family regulator